MLSANMLLEVRLRTKAVATTRTLPTFDLLALSEVELTTDKLLRLAVYGLYVYLHVACFSELSPTSGLRALEALAICQ